MKRRRAKKRASAAAAADTGEEMASKRDPAGEGKGLAARGGEDAEERLMEDMRRSREYAVAPVFAKSTFSGLFETSPPIDLPGHRGLTLEHFRTERRTEDRNGTVFEKGTYRWRDRMVRVTVNKRGENKALVDLETGGTLHRFAAKRRVYLKGHDDAHLEDFPRERIPTATMGVYRWRDRTVRVLAGGTGRVDRIVDEEDGDVVYLFEADDAQEGVFDADMFDEARFRLDRPAALARAAHLAERESREGLRFGEVRVWWPQPTEEGLHHAGTVIWLHGIGGDARESEEAVQRLQMPWVKFILPTAPTQPVGVLEGREATAWFGVERLSNRTSEEDAEGLEYSTSYVARLVEDEMLRGTHPQRIALVGIGQGGCVALNAALRGYRWVDPDEEDGLGQPQTERLACVAGLSTWLPQSMNDLRPFWFEDMQPTYWAGDIVGNRGGLPTLLCHGKTDDFVPFELGRRSYKRAEKIGLSCELKRYDMGHGLCTREIFDLEFFLGRHYLPDPVVRWSQLFGPPTVVYGVKGQLERAGMDPDAVDEYGFIKEGYGANRNPAEDEAKSLEGSAPTLRIKTPLEDGSGFVNVFGDE